MKKARKYRYDVFLSHNHADEEWTAQLASRLEKEKCGRRKLKVFFSPWDIKPGERFPEKIEQAIKSSSKVAIVMSPGGVKSNWVKLERLVTTYISVEERDDRLIPLYRRTSKIPTFLKPVVYIDFREDAKFEEGFKKLVAVLNGKQLPRIPRQASAITVSPSMPVASDSRDGENNKPPNKDVDDVRTKLVILQKFKTEQLISEGITVEYQHKILDEFLKVGKKSKK